MSRDRRPLSTAERQRKRWGRGAANGSSHSPYWYDADNDRECDHDPEEHPGEVVQEATGYSDCGYFLVRCSHPDCEETYCDYRSG